MTSNMRSTARSRAAIVSVDDAPAYRSALVPLRRETSLALPSDWPALLAWFSDVAQLQEVFKQVRIARVLIDNFRCIEHLALTTSEVTVLVGANGTGKSSVLHALRWFFEGDALTEVDLCGHDAGLTAAVEVTLDQLQPQDIEAFEGLVVNNEVRLRRSWSVNSGASVEALAQMYPAFTPVRKLAGARDRQAAYRELAQASPELGLPTIKSSDAALAAMDEWERANPDECSAGYVPAEGLFRSSAQGRLAGRLDFVLVPAVSDPEQETSDARGTLLRQLVDRTGGQSEALRERVRALEELVSGELETIIREEGEEPLRELATGITRGLSELVPSSSVTLIPRPPVVKVPPMGVGLHIVDGGMETDVRRQGHGMQRALLIAIVQQLARNPDPGAAPTLLLAIEEPELFQHPLQARHFSDTLSRLAYDSEGTVQVIYATHSEHFIDPSRFEQLRRFRKIRNQPGIAVAEVTEAAIDRVVERLAGIVDADKVATRIRITMRRQLSEAFFAQGAVIVEGHSDWGFLHGLADRTGGFDAAGISIIAGMGKPQMLIPWAILHELGVPCYVVFDGDSGLREQMTAKSKPESDIIAAVERNERINEQMLRALGSTSSAVTSTEISPAFAVFHGSLEEEYLGWTGFTDQLKRLEAADGDWRVKSEDRYRRAAADAEGETPSTFQNLVRTLLSLGAPPAPGS